MIRSQKTKHTTLLQKSKQAFAALWQTSIWYRALIIVVCLVAVMIGVMYGIAQWYIASTKNAPMVIGTSFVPSYAQSLGLDPKKTMDALITDAGVRHFRLVSYWDEIEAQPGTYDFSNLDWQFKKAEAAHAKISLSLGLRQPRWPECHVPTWAATEPDSVWQSQLDHFIQAVVHRYKQSPSLESYQLENEYFLKVFGTCSNFSRERLIREYQLVKKADPHHPVMVSRSNNAIGQALGQPKPDFYGVSVYKRVWAVPIGRYLEYPFPAWFYGFLAGTQKIIDGRDSIIHELQAEAWPPNGQGIAQTSLDEQNKSFNAERFASRVTYGKATGMRTMYLWGSEYWYYRLVVMHDPSLWHVAEQTFKQSQ